MEGIQAQLRYAQLRVQSLEQELKSVKQELEQKVINVTFPWAISLEFFFISRNVKMLN